jgi:small conductance mechanosensitive channel
MSGPTSPVTVAGGLRRVERALRPVRAMMLVLILVAGALVAGAGLAQTDEPNTEANAGTVLSPILLQPDIPAEELAFRLVPLTQDELAALSQEWLQIVRNTTLAIANRQAVMAADPDLRSDAANAELAQLVAFRSSLFERYTMVVNAFERKGGDPDAVAELRAYRNAVLFDETALASPRAIAMAFLTWLTRTDGGLGLIWDLVIIVVALAGLVMVARTARGLSRRWAGARPEPVEAVAGFPRGGGLLAGPDGGVSGGAGGAWRQCQPRSSR